MDAVDALAEVLVVVEDEGTFGPDYTPELAAAVILEELENSGWTIVRQEGKP